MFSCDSGYSDVVRYQKSMIWQDRAQRQPYDVEKKEGKGKEGKERRDTIYRYQKDDV